jgi:hypothetical protein
MIGMKAVKWMIAIAGGLLVLSSFMHSTAGTSEILAAITKGEVVGELARTLHIIWVFSSITMFLTGIMLLYLAGELGPEKKRTWMVALLIGVGLLAFGTWAAIHFYPQSNAMLGFALMGLLVAIPLLVKRRAFG